MKRYVFLFAITTIFIYSKFSNDPGKTSEEPQASSSEVNVPPNNSLPSKLIQNTSINVQSQVKQNVEEIKKPYLPTPEFEKVQTEVNYLFKNSEIELLSVAQTEDNIEINYKFQNGELKDIDQIVRKLNSRYGTAYDYIAIFNKDSERIEIQHLDDFLIAQSNKLKNKSKDISKVIIDYETPIKLKALACLTGEDWVRKSEIYKKNNCEASTPSNEKIRNVITSFYKNATPTQNIKALETEILPKWNEIFSENLAPATILTSLCYPNDNTIWMEIGCNFRLTIVKSTFK